RSRLKSRVCSGMTPRASSSRSMSAWGSGTSARISLISCASVVLPLPGAPVMKSVGIRSRIATSRGCPRASAAMPTPHLPLPDQVLTDGLAELQRQPRRSAECDRRDTLGLAGRLQHRGLCEQLLQRDARLEPCERGAETEVHTVPEREMLRAPARGIE